MLSALSFLSRSSATHPTTPLPPRHTLLSLPSSSAPPPLPPPRSRPRPPLAPCLCKKDLKAQQISLACQVRLPLRPQALPPQPCSTSPHPGSSLSQLSLLSETTLITLLPIHREPALLAVLIRTPPRICLACSVLDWSCSPSSALHFLREAHVLPALVRPS